MILIFRFMSNEMILVSIVSVNILLFLLFGDILSELPLIRDI